MTQPSAAAGPGAATEATHVRPDQVRDALVHLYDPGRLQTHPLAGLVPEAESADRGPTLQRALLEAVEALKPTRGGAPGSKAVRRYQLLKRRYIDGLTPEAVQGELLIGRSEYYREHTRALAAVAALLRPRLASAGGLARRTAREAERLGTLAGDPGGAAAMSPLPTYLTSFVGRAADLGTVEGLMADTRVLTLVGAGGCGKTRLAVEAARRLVTSFPEGIAFVDLAVLADPASVPRAVLAALGAREQPGRPIEQTLVSLLAGRRVLLVLDNCEHVLGAGADLVSLLLGRCPDPCVLATSREPLRVAGETAWRVPSLGVPPEGAVDPGTIAASPAVGLFVDRAARARPGFALTAANAAAVARVCRWLDGIPLALELAAARTTALSPQQLADRLEDAFRLLTAGDPAAQPRQRTLRALIDWSHDLLSEPERALFARLSAFAGSFALEAAEAVCGDTGVDVLALLPALVDRSLVVAEPGDDATRYRLLEPIRAHAAEKLASRGEERVLRDRHRDWFLGWIERVDLDRERTAQRAALARVERETGNLRAALRWCRDSGAATPGLRLACAVERPWHLLGQERDLRAAISALLELPAAGDVPAGLRARALTAAGNIAVGEGDARAGAEYLERGLRLAREDGDPAMLHRALWGASAALARLGRAQEAIALAEEDRRLTAAHGLTLEHRAAVTLLGSHFETEGDLDRARAIFEEALGRARATSDRVGEGVAMEHLGNLDLAAGDVAAAECRYRAAGETYRAFGDLPGELHAQLGLGLAALARGDAGAQGELRACLRRQRDFGGDAPWVPWTLAGLAGAAAREAGEPAAAARAVRLAGAAEAARAELGSTAPVPLHAAVAGWVARARALHGPDADAAEAEGRAMDAEQTIAYALSDAD
jgi:predicted ATPase